MPFVNAFGWEQLSLTKISGRSAMIMSAVYFTMTPLMIMVDSEEFVKFAPL